MLDLTNSPDRSKCASQYYFLIQENSVLEKSVDSDVSELQIVWSALKI